MSIHPQVRNALAGPITDALHAAGMGADHVRAALAAQGLHICATDHARLEAEACEGVRKFRLCGTRTVYAYVATLPTGHTIVWCEDESSNTRTRFAPAIAKEHS